MLSREEELKKIKNLARKMPSLSTTLAKVLEICNKTDASPNDLNLVISLDPVLAGQVLKVSNSTYYSLRNEVTSLTRAIIMLGMNTVKNLALSTAIIHSVGRMKRYMAFSMHAFWEHSISVGVIAKLHAKKQGMQPGDCEEYFLAGILHDLGKVCFDKEYTEVLNYAKAHESPLIQAEQQLRAITHEEAGEIVAEKWSLSQALTEVICHHHHPHLASPQNHHLVGTIAIADYYACLLHFGDAGNQFPDTSLLESMDASLVEEWDDITQMTDMVEAEIEKAKIFLDI